MKQAGFYEFLMWKKYWRSGPLGTKATVSVIWIKFRQINVAR
jgi:hypothetical protein